MYIYIHINNMHTYIYIYTHKQYAHIYIYSRKSKTQYIYIYTDSTHTYIIYIYIRRPQPSAGGARPRKSGFAAPLAAQQHILWLPLSPSRRPWRPSSMSLKSLKRFPAPSAALKPDFLLVSESDVRQ